MRFNFQNGFFCSPAPSAIVLSAPPTIRMRPEMTHRGCLDLPKWPVAASRATWHGLCSVRVPWILKRSWHSGSPKAPTTSCPRAGSMRVTSQKQDESTRRPPFKPRTRRIVNRAARTRRVHPRGSTNSGTCAATLFLADLCPARKQVECEAAAHHPLWQAQEQEATQTGFRLSWGLGDVRCR